MAETLGVERARLVLDARAAVSPSALARFSSLLARYEPSGALFGGLDVIARLVAILENVPFVALEVGFGQADAVADMLARAGFVGVERLRDLAGIERVVVGRR